MFRKFVSRVLKALGSLAFLVLFSIQLYVIHNWRFTRPYEPDPAAGWTVKLPWCLGAYGAPREKAFLSSCSRGEIIAVAAVFLGVMIDNFGFGLFPIGSRRKK